MARNVAVECARIKDLTSQLSCIIRLHAIVEHSDYGSGILLHATVSRFTKLTTKEKYSPDTGPETRTFERELEEKKGYLMSNSIIVVK
jgi:hypothetical protein